MERAYASCAAHLLGRLGITTPSTLHTHRGMLVDTERCEMCETSVARRWAITGNDGPAATALIKGYLASHDRGPTLTAMRRHPEYRLAAIATWERYAASVKGGGIMACWPCTTPVAWDLHCTSARTNPARARDVLPAHRPQAGRLAAQEERKERDALDDLFVFTDDDKREFFRTQRERIHACQRVDTTDGMRLIQPALRDWPVPHTTPARAP